MKFESFAVLFFYEIFTTIVFHITYNVRKNVFLIKCDPKMYLSIYT